MVEQIQISFDLTDEEQMVLSMIPRGKENAVKGRVIAETTRIAYDEVRAIISHLVTNHGYLVASCGKG